MPDHYVTRFMRFLVVVNGRDRRTLKRLFGFSYATVTRHLALARKLGVAIGYDKVGQCYRVVDSGPFDMAKLPATLSRMRAG